MRQIRFGVFETNSSSTHSICITKSRNAEMFFPEKLYFRCQDFGWEERRLETAEDKAAYLYAGILSLYDRKEVETAKNTIYNMLGSIGIDCDFEQAEYYGKSSWCKNAMVDHSCDNDFPDFVSKVLKNRGRLLRYLFSSQSFVLTGNDNVGTDINICAEYPHEQFYK